MSQEINNEVYFDAIKKMIDLYSVSYIVVKTNYTTHHIEKLLASCRDRGSLKWIAEQRQNFKATYTNDEDATNHVEESIRSSIDNCDMFPRCYFLKTSFISEFREWLRERQLQITDVEAPKI